MALPGAIRCFTCWLISRVKNRCATTGEGVCTIEGIRVIVVNEYAEGLYPSFPGMFSVRHHYIIVNLKIAFSIAKILARRSATHKVARHLQCWRRGSRYLLGSFPCVVNSRLVQ